MSRVAFQKKHVKKVFVCVEQQVAVPTKRLGATAKPIKVNANVQSMLKPVPREKNVKTECVVSDALLIYLLFFISLMKYYFRAWMYSCILIFIEAAQYFLTYKNKLCAGNGVDDLEKCKESLSQIKKAIPHARGVWFTDTEIASDWPKGCYLVASSGSVLFNEHATGSNHGSARHICKGPGKKYIQRSTSIRLIKEFDLSEKGICFIHFIHSHIHCPVLCWKMGEIIR